MKKSILLLLLICSLLLSGCGRLQSPLEEFTEPVITGNTTILPKNVIQIGDSFVYYPDVADGHFACTVTDVRVVSEQAQCPPEDNFEYASLTAYRDGKQILFGYDEWFTEGGAFDCGAQLILVDITVTNVDAVAWLDNGTFHGDCGYYFDEYAFPVWNIVQPMDLTCVYGSGADQYYLEKGAYACFSRRGEYAQGLSQEEIAASLGDDYSAVRVMPGETTSFTIGFKVDGALDGTPEDLTLAWLCVVKPSERFNGVNTGTFIEAKLGEDS